MGVLAGPLHGRASVAGVTEACRYNDHTLCNNPSCSCDCHRPEVNPNIPTNGANPGPEKACPMCKVKRPFAEVFCRIDGTRLASLLCNMCGAGMNPEDGYCYSCGAPKGAAPPPNLSLPTRVIVPEVLPEIDYAKQVLAGVQRELAGNGGGNEEQGKVDVQSPMQGVVEQPMGVQGTFKLVNTPNPNRVRVPGIPRVQGGPVGSSHPTPTTSQASPGAGTGAKKFNLPIKPS